MKDLITKFVGRTGYIMFRSLKIQVRVEDVRTSYGRTQYLVTPVNGEGQEWVEGVVFPDDAS